MELIRGLINLQQQSSACVATIGNFDGIHLGHKVIVDRLIEKARLLNLPSCVLLFEPHPKEFFMQQSAPARLTCFREKFQYLKSLGVNKLVVLQFNQSMREMLAVDFIDEVLIKKLKVKHLVVGDDFHFGFQRQGNYQLLEQKAANQYTLEPTPSFLVENKRVSSTLVRQVLAKNQLDLAQSYLGRHYSITGKVGYGRQLGRTIGFPTANVALKRQKPAISGVYLVQCGWKLKGKQQRAWGVANCGSRPTVDGTAYRLEVHLLGVSDNLYGIELSVTFWAHLRTEQKFNDLAALQSQISKDATLAKHLISQFETN